MTLRRRRRRPAPTASTTASIRPSERREDQYLLLVDVEASGTARARRGRRPRPRGRRRHLRRGPEPLELRGDVVAAGARRAGRRPQRDGAPPVSPPGRSTSAPCSTRSGREAWPARGGPRGRRAALVGVGARLEQQPHVLLALAVERVGEGVRPLARAPCSSSSRRHSVLSASVEGRPTRCRPGRRRLEQQARDLPGRGRRRRRRRAVIVAVLVRERRRWDRRRAPAARARGRAARRPGAGVVDRRPPPRPAGSVQSPSQPRPRTSPPTGSPRAPAAPRASPRPLRAAATWRHDERVGPASAAATSAGQLAIAVLGGDDELGAGEDRLAPAEPLERIRLAGARGADELLGLLPKLIEIHDDLPPRGPCPRRRAEKRSAVVRSGGRGGSALPADRVRPRARRESYGGSDQPCARGLRRRRRAHRASLRRMLATCRCTVCSLRTSDAAISRFERPDATSRSTSVSRPLRGESPFVATRGRRRGSPRARGGGRAGRRSRAVGVAGERHEAGVREERRELAAVPDRHRLGRPPVQHERQGRDEREDVARVGGRSSSRRAAATSASAACRCVG